MKLACGSNDWKLFIGNMNYSLTNNCREDRIYSIELNTVRALNKDNKWHCPYKIMLTLNP